MKKDTFFIIILLCLIFCHHSVLGEDNAEKQEIRKLLGEAYIMTEDYESAEDEYRKTLEKDPKNVDAKIGLADILSWQKKYDEAITLYDEILSDEENVKVRLQKARVLGWARRYNESLEEYKKIFDIQYDEIIELEMDAKKAYWDNRVKHAILYYKELIEKDSKNQEAMFDLSQIYCYQSMWEDAMDEYERILEISPTHLRAKEGLQKTELISGHIAAKTGYKFFEADSPSRDNDIKRNTFYEEFSFPVNPSLKIKADYNFTIRNFADFNDVVENNGLIKVSYTKNPDAWFNGFYSVYVYDKDIKTMHNFGGDCNFRIFDIGISSFSYERERLENNSTVIRDHYYKDSFKQRFDLDINQRLKIGLDYLFAYYSDDNYKNESGFDLLYYLSLDPMRFTVKYRYFYREFNDKVGEYFSPKGFSANRISFNWRHYLDKEEIFFGADDLYYDLKYNITIDSEDIVGHKFSGGFNWDINKRLNFNIQASITNSSTNVYEDKSLTAAIKYYF